jgi:TolB protein
MTGIRCAVTDPPRARQTRRRRKGAGGRAASLASLAGLVVAAGVLATSGGATPSGTNGRIVYAKGADGGGKYELLTIRADGSGTKRITRATEMEALHPDWAPNGQSLVFELDRKDTAGIAVISADGSGLRILTPSGLQGQPSFSPDGKWIVYERDLAPGNNGVWIMHRNGTEPRRLTRNPFRNGDCGCDTDPNMSPDGKTVSFVRIKKQDRLQALFSVGIDGSGLRQLTPYASEVAIKHDWSPDGQLIVLTTNADFASPGSANLATIRPDGSRLTKLTHFTNGTTNAFAGSFSPDGKQIVFRLEQGEKYSLAVIDRDGQNLRKLTTGKDKPRFIDWGTHP